ncbi:hypothetical protein NQ315_002801 [Exocentrus adspersus]|uniref:Integrase zinc-binding domain-containing protein n=1 Tax=Exocentrus adspersus TaxID=1586481 RepID=A0AAV8VK05_9CUCU|nr:hypothetical protein NQ315_002801 [Exocentrus adspersus]
MWVLAQFVRELSMLMAEANFDLRGWEFTQPNSPKKGDTNAWFVMEDTLTINGENLKQVINVDVRSKPVTKRLILSVAQRVFDPIGFTCPATLSPKLLLQKLWEKQLGWDTQVDSETAQTFYNWIGENWTPFVGNRVAEIRSLTAVDSWRHIPGSLNPADLPSRGCSPKRLFESKWWEGPTWLYRAQDSWKLSIPDHLECDEEEINSERRKRIIANLLNYYCGSEDLHLTYFSKYLQVIRRLAWIFRFIYNAKHPNSRRQGNLNAEEIDAAEVFLFKMPTTKELVFYIPFVIKMASYGKNQVSATDKMKKAFVFQSYYLQNIQWSVDKFLKYTKSLAMWGFKILGGRRAVKDVISKCVICKRHNTAPFSVETPPLPLDRVKNAVPFEVTGVDYTDPLYFRSGEKVCVCLFTCAIYRAVHLELTTSLSTQSFMQVLRRFVARRGRPKTIYSDRYEFCRHGGCIF